MNSYFSFCPFFSRECKCNNIKERKTDATEQRKCFCHFKKLEQLILTSSNSKLNSHSAFINFQRSYWSVQLSWTIVLAKLEAHSGSSIRRAKVNLVLGNLKTIEVCQNNIQIVKAVSVKHSYHQKRSPEAGLRSKSAFFELLGCQKLANCLAELLWMCSTSN